MSIKQEEYKGLSIKIDHDELNEAPIHCDNLVKFYCRHRRYNLGNTDEDAEMGDVRLPLYLYDHSGLSISTTPFSCPWDSGRLGNVYMKHEDFEKYYLDESKGMDDSVEFAKSVLRLAVKEYDYYLRGECYQYTILSENGTVMGSCGGFIGDIDYCLEQAKSEADSLAEQVTYQI